MIAKMVIVQENNHKIAQKGFTHLELLIAVIIIVFFAVLTVPMLSKASDVQLRSAAAIVASDLEYAKNMAINNQEYYSITFDKQNDLYTYKVHSQEGIIDHPLKTGSLFKVDLNDNRRFNRISVNAGFDSNQAVTFDYLGSPFSGVGTENPLEANGQIILKIDDLTMTVLIEPVTGYITVQQ